MNQQDNSLIIRRASRKDAKALLDLINALADFEKLQRPSSAARRRLIKDGFGRPKRFDTYLAKTDGKAVGYAIVFETYSSFLALPTLFLEDIFVLPDHRGRKIGLRLFQHCVAEAQRRACGRMEWQVLDWNQNAIGFYRKVGATRMAQWLPFRLDRTKFAAVLKL